MRPLIATTLEDAADLFDLMQDQATTEGDVMDLYVEPPGARPDPKLPSNPPVRRLIADRFVRRRQNAEKIFVTGQKGAGKTMTLARVVNDPSVLKHFAPLMIRATRHIPVGAADIRLVLVTVIAQVSQYIDAERLTERVDLAGARVGGISRVLHRWVRLFAKGDVADAPETFQNAKTKLSAQVLELSEEIVRDPERRKQVLSDPHYSVTELHRVASALIDFVHEALAVRIDEPRFLLLIVDDLDKYTVPAEVQSIFHDGFEALHTLPCACVFTYPYFLNFTDSAIQRDESLAILNVKVAERTQVDPKRDPVLLPLDRRELLQPAREFFNELYGRLAARDLVVDQAVIDRAALLSAGIPREFMRLLSKGFELCLYHQKRRLDLPSLDVARIGLQQTMVRTANEPWKQAALKLVQASGAIPRFSVMLDTVHVVEYVNHSVWYGVHPAIEEQVGEWIRRDRNLLLERGADESSVDRELEAQWRKDALVGLPKGDG